MSFFGSLFGKDQAKAAKKAAGYQLQGTEQAKKQAGQFQTRSLADLDKALKGALGAYNTGESGAVGALKPYADAGGNALKTYLSALGIGSPEDSANALATLQSSPDYQFRYKQGQTALDRQLNAGGRSYGGSAIKAATEYGQGFASNEMGNLLDRLGGAAQQGQQAAGGISNVLSQFAGNRAQAMLGTGEAKTGVRATGLQAITDAINSAAAARAGREINVANAKAGGVQNILGILGGIGKMAFGGFGGGGAPSYAGLA